MQPPDLIDTIEKGFQRADEELPALSLYGWAMQHLDHEPDTWDEESIHLSDYKYSLDPEEGGCGRQLYHRLRQDASDDPSLWERLMWDQGFAMQIRVSWLIAQGLPEEWDLEAVEMDVSDGLPGDDVGSCDLVLSSDSHILGVEMKTQRGRAFQYLDEPKDSHVMQAEAEAYALGEMYPKKDLSHRLLYLDREGQNEPLVFPTEYSFDSAQRVLVASAYVHEIADSLDEDAPEPLAPEISVRENKSANSIYLEQPWVCDYCPYYQEACPGALPPYLTEHGIVAKGDHEDLSSLEWKVNGDLQAEIEQGVARAVQAENVSFK